MLSPPVGALTANAAVENSEISLTTTLGTAAAAVPAVGTGYILDSIGCSNNPL